MQGMQELNKPANEKISKFVIIIGIVIGVTMNWLALYLNIILGLLSVGISSFVVLLLIKVLLRQKATSKNLALVSVAYGATSSAEASVGLLFLIWLYHNAEVYGLSFNPPSWLLPSQKVLTERIIFTFEWIVPLLIHYFLMFIPGITGLILGIYLAPKFLNNDQEYPFPGTIQRVKTVEVLVTNQRSKIQLFTRFLIIGFLIAFITLFIPIIDFSNLNSGFIFGIMLGTIGITMIAIGVIVNSPKITIPAGISSIITYTVIGPIVFDQSEFQSKLAEGIFINDFYGVYSYLLQSKYLSFIIGFILSAVILSPFVFSMIKKGYKYIRRDNSSNNLDDSNNEINYSNNPSVSTEVHSKTNNIENTSKYLPESRRRLSRLFTIIGKRELILFSIYSISLIISVLFVVNFNLLANANYLVIILLLIWILFLGSIIQGVITVTTVAKSSTAIVPPFIFDNLPLFLVGARGITPYVATPKGEIGETISVVSTLKFSQQMKVNFKQTLTSFLAGYFTAALVTPFFALFLWKALGIGTLDFPAPSFPIALAMIGPFAAGAIDVFLNVSELIIGAIFALFFPTIGVSLAIGMFFPPHMAICLMLGGAIALILEKRKGKEWMNDKGKMAATALEIGATFTVPILILLKLFF